MSSKNKSKASPDEWEILLTKHAPTPGEGHGLVVSQGLLPCLLWQDVEVIREVRKELTLLERFLLEAGLRLQKVTPADLEEITSLPAQVLRRFLTQLAHRRLFEETTGSVFCVQAQAAEEAAKEKATFERVSGQFDFLFLPRTDDLIAAHAKQSDFQELLRIESRLTAPLPADFAGSKLGDFLNTRISMRKAAGLPADAVGVSDALNKTPIPEECPAYDCSGMVHRADAPLELWVRGRSLTHRDNDCETEVYLELEGARGLAQHWMRSAESLQGAAYCRRIAARLCEELEILPKHCPTVRANHNGSYSASLSPDAAEAAFRKGINLAMPFGLNIRNGDMAIEAELGLQPEKPEQAWRFALDQAATALLGHPDRGIDEAWLRQLLKEAANQVGLHPKAHSALEAEAFLDRVWQLRHFAPIYRYRARSDFDYE